MFTGLIKEIGTIKDIRKTGDGLKITIASNSIISDTVIDDSIAVNGTCLTVVTRSDSSFTVQAVHETVSKTTLMKLKTGDRVNLEPALRPADRLGGHIVQGHVDGLGTITDVVDKQNGKEFYIRTEKKTSKYIVSKGSVCLDGISLTVAEINSELFRIAVIPHTLFITTAGSWRTGQEINIETDILGRYIEKFTKGENKGLTNERLKELGY